MAKMRVHDLAKEYGMQSKELLEHLADMKIPAKSDKLGLLSIVSQRVLSEPMVFLISKWSSVHALTASSAIVASAPRETH